MHNAEHLLIAVLFLLRALSLFLIYLVCIIEIIYFSFLAQFLQHAILHYSRQVLVTPRYLAVVSHHSMDVVRRY